MVQLTHSTGAYFLATSLPVLFSFFLLEEMDIMAVYVLTSNIRQKKGISPSEKPPLSIWNEVVKGGDGNTPVGRV